MSFEDSNLVNTLSQRVNELIADGKFEESEKIARSAVETASRRARDDRDQVPSLVTVLEQLANILAYKEKPNESEVVFLEALDHCDHEDIPIMQKARLQSSLAFLYESADQFEKARELYEQVIEIYKFCKPPAFEDLANMHNNLGMIYKNFGNFDKAEENYLLSLDIYEHHLGLKSNEAATVYNNLGSLYQSAGYVEQSKDMHQEALTIRVELFGIDNPDVAQSYSNFASAIYEAGDLLLAQNYYEKALEIYERNISDYANDYEIVSDNYCDILTLSGKGRKATKISKRTQKLISEYM